MEESKSSGIKSVAAFCFFVNFTLGIGVLTISHGFVKCGWLYSTILFIVIALVVFITHNYVLEVYIRGQTWKPFQKSSLLDVEVNSVVFPLTPKAKTPMELNELVGLFLGKKFRLLYETFFIAYEFVVLWAYFVVFGKTIAETFTISSISYELQVKLFGSILIVISTIFIFKGLKEQVVYQVLMFIMRLLLIVLIVSTTFGAEIHHPYPGVNKQKDSNWSEIPTFYMGSTSVLFGCLLFALVAHYGIPTFIQTMAKIHEGKKVVMSSTVTLVVIYFIVAFVTSFYFGNQITDPLTLLWIKYNWGQSDTTAFDYFVRYFVLLFPAMDLGSCFPLGAQVLINTLDRTTFGARIGEVKVKLLVIVVPTILGWLSIETDLAEEMLGIFGVFLAFVVPPLLNLKSNAVCKKRFGKSVTIWSIPFVSTSSAFQIFAVFIGGLLLLLQSYFVIAHFL
eukprot:TRINITY_DN1711_c0_g1_i1.p1 TRINITY_DN1711_c0_g1~~TRINITY_DN1711_c0_g1_i1.p1  ORF type:complete len:458 (+),score=76.57 TRINITY_DN1711_c0_g1_i1:27-1376(+)